MLNEILQRFAESSYDFRVTANPNDPCKEKYFASWVPVYRMKYAIAKVLAPKTILEIGVRYGYSAHAFLSASLRARYLGIDNDSTDFGGIKHPIDYAHRLLEPYDAAFLIVDSTKLNAFPQEHYDLIHIDGRQDDLGTTHDFELALRAATYILLDGYWWTRQNYDCITKLVFKHRRKLAYWAVIPEFAGEMLIKVGTKENSAVEPSA
jgi:hypothetical protein